MDNLLQRAIFIISPSRRNVKHFLPVFLYFIEKLETGSVLNILA